MSGLAVAGRYTNDCCYALSCRSTCVKQKILNLKKTLAKTKNVQNVKTGQKF